MGNKLKNKKNNEFAYKQLLIFSGIFTLTSYLFFVLFGYTLGVLKHDAFGMYGGLIISVPLVVHLYCWGLFCEWKNVKYAPIILKGFAILWAIVVCALYVTFIFDIQPLMLMRW